MPVIRQLTNIHFLRGTDKDSQRDVEWAQRKIETDGEREAKAYTTRVSDHADQIDTVMVPNAQTGALEERAVMQRRYAKAARKEVRDAGEAFCTDLQHAVPVGVEVIGFSYAPGSPGVDVRCRKKLETLDWSGTIPLQDEVYLEMAQAFIELVAEKFADPNQPLTTLPMLAVEAA